MRGYIFWCCLMLPCHAMASLTFALVPKSTNSPFFAQAEAGCQQAAKELGVTCLYIGSEQFDIREQNNHIEQLLATASIDGLAISVSGSAFLAEHSMQQAMPLHLPVVTFDSDFAAPELQRFPGIRQAYIGTDNYAFGFALGQQILQHRPDGGTLCVISGHVLSTNMQVRMDGLRDALQMHARMASASPRLSANGWSEHSRCPLYSRDDLPRSVRLLEYALSSHREAPLKPDTIVALGAWPQFDASTYRTLVRDYLSELNSKQLVLVMGDTLPQQLQLLNEGLAHANVGQSAYEMGRQAIHTLYRISQGEHYQEIVHTPVTICTAENIDRCTEPSPNRDNLQ